MSPIISSEISMHREKNGTMTVRIALGRNRRGSAIRRLLQLTLSTDRLAPADATGPGGGRAASPVKFDRWAGASPSGTKWSLPPLANPAIPVKIPDAPFQGPFFMYAESAQTTESCFGWTSSMRRILFVDDHPIYRDGVRRVLESSSPDVQIFTADGATSAPKLLAGAPDIDLCLTDQRLLDGEGASLARRVRELYPSIAVGLLCAEPTLTLANETGALGAGASLSEI